MLKFDYVVITFAQLCHIYYLSNAPLVSLHLEQAELEVDVKCERLSARGRHCVVFV